MKQIMFIVALFGLSIFSSVEAQVATPRIGQHQIQQKKRIAHGRAYGNLSRAETRQLCRQQHRVRQHKRIARADGRVTPRERAHIRSHQRHASANIYRKNHNAVRHGHGPW